MAAAHLDRGLLIRRHHVQVPFFEFFSSFVFFGDALEHDIGSLRFVEGDHFDSCPVLQLD